MKHVSPLMLAGSALLAALVPACGKSHEASEAGVAPPVASSGGSWLTRRAPGWVPPPVDTQSPTLPQPLRAPDWDLDSDDPAVDYVRRYAFFTKRYGDTLDCIDLGVSQPADDKRRVEVKTAARCPGAGTQRDVFFVDLAGDHLSVDDKTKRDPLARWPDGSSTDGPPAEAIRQIDRMPEWKGPLNDVLRKALLVPVRVQAYGRGTYPVISLAGWHGVVQLDAPPDALRPFAEDLCRANGGMPMGIMAAADRTRILRIRCPAATTWAKL
jgi:hypothetical protein